MIVRKLKIILLKKRRMTKRRLQLRLRKMLESAD
uniref:Uncharacterized protein n=1 Tax=Siphoviridae sp. ctvhu9 TaxID=2827968 RepID=A0A8S5SKA4_9CAUD|nr:MAG TPA: hypothetical protein [Siphoviridae sp. ctvhu9]DAR56152.1 MAG TPA: hypothetical protein [Caudoviricetes sp.]DAU99017.1 MAG TPA: hypothetical protein [Bacteriophage sp.]